MKNEMLTFCEQMLGLNGDWPRFVLCNRAALMLHFSFVFTFSNQSFCHTLASCQITDRSLFDTVKKQKLTKYFDLIFSKKVFLDLIRDKFT